MAICFDKLFLPARPLPERPPPPCPTCSREVDAVDPCAADKSCIPTRDDYNLNSDPEDILPPFGVSHWTECR